MLCFTAGKFNDVIYSTWTWNTKGWHFCWYYNCTIYIQ